MKTALKIAGGVLLLLAVAVGVVVVNVRSQLAKPTGARIEAEPLATGVLVKFGYAWIVKTPHGAFLVDTGPDRAGEELLAELKLQGIAPEAVHTVLVTHGHEDHWAAAALFPKAKVMVGPGDAAAIRGERRLMPAPVEALWRLMGNPRPPVPANLVELKGGEALDLDGVPVQVISLPGHTQGSLAFLTSDLLFTGDSLMARPDGSLDLGPRLYCEDAEQNRRSLEKLKDLTFSRIADGHAGLTVDAKTRLAAFLGVPPS